jgi:hypothetical protein
MKPRLAALHVRVITVPSGWNWVQREPAQSFGGLRCSSWNARVRPRRGRRAYANSNCYLDDWRREKGEESFDLQPGSARSVPLRGVEPEHDNGTPAAASRTKVFGPHTAPVVVSEHHLAVVPSL